ncbi:MAG TPA: cytochrome c [Terriglobales bacterium]
MSARLLIAAGIIVTVSFSCGKQQKGTTANEPPLSQPTERVQTSNLKPEQKNPGAAMKNPYEARAYDVSEGQRLYTAFNCAGCHAVMGGGSIGPPLRDGMWIYGGSPENIFASIVEGRPNGMPSFRGRIADFEVWRIVAYVRSLSGQLRSDVAPARSDHMSMAKPPNEVKKKPMQGTTGRPVQQ